VTADITAKSITLANVAAANKVYDGNTTAAVTGSFSGLIAGESLNLAGLFDTKDAGTGKSVTISTADGANASGIASNYVLTGAGQTVYADINQQMVPIDPTPNGPIPYETPPAAPRINPTLVELTNNKSNTTESRENGNDVVTTQLEDGSKSLRVVNRGVGTLDREFITIVSISN
jgi:hypothetical protein